MYEYNKVGIDVFCIYYINKRGFYENLGICINLKFIDFLFVINIYE